MRYDNMNLEKGKLWQKIKTARLHRSSTGISKEINYPVAAEPGGNGSPAPAFKRAGEKYGKNNSLHTSWNR